MSENSTTVRYREDVFPRQLRELEEGLIKERRIMAGPPQGAEQVGIALSGGGIRSATFCLGLFQGLARRGLVRRLDYLSTVSGGGYFGSFLGRLFTRPWINGEQPLQSAPNTSPAAGPPPPNLGAPPSWSTPATPPPEASVWDTSNMFRFLGLIRGKGGADVVRCYNRDANPAHAEGLTDQSPGVERVEYILNCPASKPMSWLRDNGRYLSPNGTSDMLTDASLAVRNWVALTAVMGLFLILCFLGFNLLRGVLWRFYPDWWLTNIEWPLLLKTNPAKGYLWWSPYIYLPAIALVVFAIPLGWAYWLTQGGLAGGRMFLPPLTAFLTALAAATVGYLENYRPDLARFWYAVAGLILLALVCWSVVRLLCPLAKGTPGATRWMRSQLTLSLKTAMVTVVVLLALAVADTVGQSLYAVLSVSGWDVLFSWKSLATVSGLTAALAGARNLALLLEKFPKLGAWRMPMGALAVILALVVMFALPVILAIVAHGVAWSWRVPQPELVTNTIPTVELSSVLVTNRINPGFNLLSSSLRRDRVFLSDESHIVVGETDPPPMSGTPKARMSFKAQIWAGLICLLLAITYGQTFTFLNLSSLQQVYGARLVRSYLGASNPNRWEGAGQRLSDVVHCDDLRFQEYRPHAYGGPLHLINVTLNETLSGKTNVEFRDRKGLCMAVGPCGLSVGLRDHAVWVEKNDCPGASFIEPVSYRESKFHALATSAGSHAVESLSLGHWIAISGAAFTTGLGARTSMGKSLLLGLANVRLGYWWDSHIRPQERGNSRTPLKAGGRLAEMMNQMFYVQTNLLNEYLGHFHGPARRLWYLSDGGHYENTGAYELLRRRVPFIIISDNGCDPTYDFADLANLVRKARVDFSAEIEFVRRKKSDPANSPKSLEAANPAIPATGPLPFLEDLVHPEFCDLIGAPEDFKSLTDDTSEAGETAPPRRVPHHALLARVRYPREKLDAQPEVSWLLVLKPGLTGDERLDLIQYQKTQPDFPQESTMDQYFDEAQWESYRKLGEHIAGLVFATPKDPSSKWYPAKMCRPM